MHLTTRGNSFLPFQIIFTPASDWQSSQASSGRLSMAANISNILGNVFVQEPHTQVIRVEQPGNQHQILLLEGEQAVIHVGWPCDQAGCQMQFYVRQTASFEPQNPELWIVVTI